MSEDPGRYDYLGRRDHPLNGSRNAAPRRAAPGAHKHREAFCLMWYGCPCGHRERFWNSRDGVTPFGTVCPSCGEPSMRHIQFELDTYEPEHQPAHGQRVWVDMTQHQAEAIARRRIAHAKSTGRQVDESPAYLQLLTANIYVDGFQPWLEVWGYRETPAG